MSTSFSPCSKSWCDAVLQWYFPPELFLSINRDLAAGHDRICSLRILTCANKLLQKFLSPWMYDVWRIQPPVSKTAFRKSYCTLILFIIITMCSWQNGDSGDARKLVDSSGSYIWRKSEWSPWVTYYLQWNWDSAENRYTVDTTGM